MEGILNLGWLMIAVASVIRLCQWARGEADHRRVAIVAVATVCLLAVLFPIVSVSDDLQETVAALEDHVAVYAVPPPVALGFIADLRPVVALIGFATEMTVTIVSYAGEPLFVRRGPPSASC